MLLDQPSQDKLLSIHDNPRNLHLYERGEDIPLRSQSIWYVNRGVVQLFQLNFQGEETVLGWGVEGSFFGLDFTALETFQVRALSDVYLQCYSMAEVEHNLLLTQRVLSHLQLRIQQTEKLLAIAGLKTVESRLKELLVLLTQHLGEDKNSTIRIRVRLTHQTLADVINTTRVTITRIMGYLQKQNLISVDEYHHINVHKSLLTYAERSK